MYICTYVFMYRWRDKCVSINVGLIYFERLNYSDCHLRIRRVSHGYHILDHKAVLWIRGAAKHVQPHFRGKRL